MASSATVRSKAGTASTVRPMAAKSTRAIVIDGTVVTSMARMWVYRSVPAMAGARLVVSDSGDILSPK